MGDETYCRCQVALEHVVTLGDTTGLGMLLGEIEHVRRYELERWSLDGIRTHLIQRGTDWFEPRLHHSWGGPDEPMEPHITDLSVDARGYLRTIIVRGGPRWAELLPVPTRRPATGDVVYPVPPGIGLFESIVEIIDPESGRLFARGVLRPELYGFVDPEHVFSYHEDDVGRPTISIWRLGLSEIPPET